MIACLQAAGPRGRTALPALEALLKSDDPGIRALSPGLAIVSIDGQETPRSVATLIRIVVDPKSPQDARESATSCSVRRIARCWQEALTPKLIRQLADADAGRPAERSQSAIHDHRRHVRRAAGPDLRKIIDERKSALRSVRMFVASRPRKTTARDHGRQIRGSDGTDVLKPRA